MTPEQLRKHIIKPALEHMRMWSQEAEDLVLRTAYHESDKLRRITQYDGGPARSYFQIEPATLFDLYDNYLRYRTEIKDCLDSLKIKMYTDEENLLRNCMYAAAVCRLCYYRKPGAIPSDLKGQAEYWKEHYNTHLGKGTVEEFIENVKEL